MNQRMRRAALTFVFAAAQWTGLFYAQTSTTVEFIAMNKADQTVKDLTPGDVELKIDGRTVSIDSLRLIPKQPPQMIVLVDTSYLAMNNRQLLKDMVTAFIDLKPPSLEMALATINDPQQFLSPFQTSTDELVSSLQKIKFGGPSPLSHSILDALAHFGPGSGTSSITTRRVLITFSDGSDDSSSDQWDLARSQIAKGGVIFYEINHVKPMKAFFDSKYKDQDLIRLAEESGGRAFRLNGLEDVGGIAREIFDRETLTYVARINGEGKSAAFDKNHVKMRSHRKDVRLEVVSIH